MGAVEAVTVKQDPAYYKRWKYERDTGIQRTHPAAPVAAHIEALRSSGLSYGAIARLSGVSVHTVHRASSTTSMSAASANALLAVQPADALRGDADVRVPSHGAQRRISALMALGWTHGHIGEAAGISRVRVAAIMRQGRIVRATHDKICGAYDQLSMSVGPSEETRRRAAAAGYVPPLAWDDELLDEPGAKPWRSQEDLAAMREVRNKRVLELSRAGMTSAAIGAEFGLDPASVRKLLRQLRTS